MFIKIIDFVFIIVIIIIKKKKNKIFIYLMDFILNNTIIV